MKNKTGSDYKTAQILGVTRSAVSIMRKKGALNEENALFIADYLDINPDEILLSSKIAASKGRIRDSWVRISERAGF